MPGNTESTLNQNEQEQQQKQKQNEEGKLTEDDFVMVEDKTKETPPPSLPR
eukprot:CAMPEP_0201495660 /NCGR_PEP_ID=MMETSP0151_2-20130828/55323_1 /ASSEMBLY_ACC=CAM_ASM_000257 /TAXON_ID=200890 /ORGANISM="Paramoeba atlantica, Strain 621/1 / CCAP 1560/9" /LENGTH=50 /DNA_ID=CAMNT_0047884861 /DNA_START=47 /DNA_END=195 /DNA_ORIENTATION=-